MHTKKRPTIRDVALEAGVSKSLVSLVYSDEEKVSPERRAAVHAAAKKLGFTPNAWARSLATGASDFIGILVVDLHNAVYTELADSIRVELLKHGHESFMTAAIISESGGVKHVEPSTVQTLLDLRPRGIVVIGDLPDESPLDSVPVSIPVIKVFTVPSKQLTREVNLRSNDAEGMRQIIGHLKDNAHKAIAYVGPTMSDVDRFRSESFAREMTSAGLQAKFFISDRSTQGGYEQVRHVLQDNPEITAIVCFNDVVAVGALDAIEEHVQSGGHPVAVTGYDNTHIAALKQISLTSIEQEKDAMAVKVAELISADVPWEEMAGQDIQFTPTLIVRGSSSIKPR